MVCVYMGGKSGGSFANLLGDNPIPYRTTAAPIAKSIIGSLQPVHSASIFLGRRMHSPHHSDSDSDSAERSDSDSSSTQSSPLPKVADADATPIEVDVGVHSDVADSDCSSDSDADAGEQSARTSDSDADADACDQSARDSDSNNDAGEQSARTSDGADSDEELGDADSEYSDDAGGANDTAARDAAESAAGARDDAGHSSSSCWGIDAGCAISPLSTPVARLHDAGSPGSSSSSSASSSTPAAAGASPTKLSLRNGETDAGGGAVARVVPSPYAFKVVFLGDSAVGKTSTIRRAVRDEFEDKYVCTIGIDFLTFKLEHQNRSFKVHIWDTAAQERFRCIVASYIRGCDAVVLMYDITNSESLHSLEYWYKEVTNTAPDLDRSNIIMVGNKIDCPPTERQVTSFEGAAFARSLGLGFVEVSAKSKQGIEQLRECIAMCAKRGLENLLAEEASRKAGTGLSTSVRGSPSFKVDERAFGLPYVEQPISLDMMRESNAGSSGSHWRARGDSPAETTSSRQCC